MRRLLAILAVLAVAVVLVAGTGASDGDDGGRTYKVKLDNAFGLIEGADVKVAGVRAGKIDTLDLDESDMRAVVGITITETGFEDLRKDVFCETRPQSLIGEYFLDCKPGKSPQKLDEDATIPVEQTATTIAPDLIQNIMRRPYRERLTIIYHELGAALAARGARPQRDDPPRQPGAARDRPRAEDPARAAAHDPRPLRRRGQGRRPARRQPRRRPALRSRGARHRARVRRAHALRGAQLPAAARLPARAAARRPTCWASRRSARRARCATSTATASG